MDAIVLAGGLNSGALRKVSPAQYEAEIEVAGRPMLEYVISALSAVSRVQRIIVVAPDIKLSPEIKSKVSALAPPGKNMIESLNNGIKALNTTEPVLVISSDIPLITPEALNDFLDQCTRRQGDVYYPVVRKETNEEKYPGVQRTYVKLREGTFTGGNLVLLSPRIIQNNMEMLTKAVMLRKKPLQLCAMLGLHYLFYLLIGRLTIRDIEKRISKSFLFTGVGIISTYPEVGIDVDKPSDLQLAARVLSGR
ncbi:MAG: nucleotidyltransferase family protein [Firmicutes bacterium]|nr:nucleotidyltransferase family protein [Bacillota bacterium]